MTLRPPILFFSWFLCLGCVGGASSSSPPDGMAAAPEDLADDGMDTAVSSDLDFGVDGVADVDPDGVAEDIAPRPDTASDVVLQSDVADVSEVPEDRAASDADAPVCPLEIVAQASVALHGDAAPCPGPLPEFVSVVDAQGEPVGAEDLLGSPTVMWFFPAPLTPG